VVARRLRQPLDARRVRAHRRRSRRRRALEGVQRRGLRRQRPLEIAELLVRIGQRVPRREVIRRHRHRALEPGHRLPRIALGQTLLPQPRPARLEGQLALVGIGQKRRGLAPGLDAAAQRLHALDGGPALGVETARRAVVGQHLLGRAALIVGGLGQVTQHQRPQRRRQQLGVLLAQR
jgi:hypothetical protein